MSPASGIFTSGRGMEVVALLFYSSVLTCCILIVVKRSVRTMNIDDRPTDWPTNRPCTFGKFQMVVTLEKVQPIHFMFGSMMGFSRSAVQMALFPVGPNPRWWLVVILKISNIHISAMGHPMHSHYALPLDTIQHCWHIECVMGDWRLISHGMVASQSWVPTVVGEGLLQAGCPSCHSTNNIKTLKCNGTCLFVFASYNTYSWEHF